MKTRINLLWVRRDNTVSHVKGRKTAAGHFELSCGRVF